MKSQKWLRPASVAGLLWAAGIAQAALTPVAPACSASITEPTWADCAGAFDGNNKNQQADVLAAILSEFGLAGAAYAGASDDAGGGPFAGNPGGASGTLTFDTAMDDAFVLSLKAGDAFSLFYFDGAGGPISSIDYTTLGVSVNVLGIGNGLSHASLYTVPAIPEPQTYALMLAGLAAMGFVARRRKTA